MQVFFGDSLAPMRVRVDMLDKAIDDTGEDLNFILHVL